MNRKITIHQAYYGEVNRAHACISQTLIDHELTSFLLTFTDRPGAVPPGVTLLPYLAGCSFSKYYILSKTFPDPTTSRGGMVFTHALIIDIDDATTANDLQSFLNVLATSIRSKDQPLRPIVLEPNTRAQPNFAVQPKYIQESVQEFLSGKNILLAGDIDSVSAVVQTIWTCSGSHIRKKIKFRASFSPADIESVPDMTLASIQKDFQPRWRGIFVIDADNTANVEIKSPSQSLFLGNREGNSFHQLVEELNVPLDDHHYYVQCESLFLDYKNINQIDDGNKIRQCIRLLTKLSPSPTNGKAIKLTFLSRLSSLLDSRKDSNLKALRNMDLTPYAQGEKILGDCMLRSLLFEMKNPSADTVGTVADLVILSTSSESQPWWRSAIEEALTTVIHSENPVAMTTFFDVLNSSTQAFEKLTLLLAGDETNENRVRKFLPINMSSKTSSGLADFAKRHNWYMLHADILCQTNSVADALTAQLELEINLPLSQSLGVNYLANKLSPPDLINASLRLCSDKLIQLSISLVTSNRSLMILLLGDSACWLQVWTGVSLSSRKPFAGIEGHEQTFTHRALDELVKNKPVDETLLELISHTPQSNLSTYSNRSKVWMRLSLEIRQRFIKATVPSIEHQLLAGTLDPASIEFEIVSELTSDESITELLSKNRSNIEPVLIIFENFGDRLKDKFLSDFVINYWPAISEDQSHRLGKLIANFEFETSARSVYDKIQQNPSFKVAYNECHDLVHLNWWESLFASTSSKSEQGSKNMVSPQSTARNKMRQALPTVVILTALKEEYDAVRANLTDVVDADRNDTNYEAGIFAVNGREIAKVIIRECGAKNTTSSQETERAIQYFIPDMILFVGIAGSRKPNDFSVGDVIFPEKVYSYEGGKSEKEAFVSRPDLATMTFSLMETAKKIRRKEDWKVLIKGNWPTTVKANLGVIASGEQVVEHYKSEVGQILTKHFNDTSAIEMEGFGFAKAASRQGRQTSNTLVGIVRGISDIVEQESIATAEQSPDRRPTNAKQFASDTAAAFAFWLIWTTYTK